ncbi:hypothetical protein CG740_37260 [Streptomyces sp. CB01201]|uniref:hypothetical protein n=1 Tax=Streptomyces sp. CB01201 TaxID=2020324 RepID=UPI000C2777AC|nr:hypothetical protein [Streptomyces sp. CB01201]PJM98135.1 hypothetical protein CG740_37260 [Streptomyces sp. CB01201]
MALNQNWPVIEEAWGPYWNATTALTPVDRFVEVTPTTTSKSDSKRGRQYELDQIQPGTASTVLSNPTGTLDPANSASPFYGKIAPFQPVRRRAMWPPSINLLSQIMATGGDLGGYAVGASVLGADIFSDTDPSSSGIVAASATAFQGANVLQFSVPSGSATNARICYTPETAAQPGQTYTVQMRIRNITPGTTLQVKGSQGWYLTPLASTTTFAYGSAVTLTGSATAAWTQITATATCPAGALGMNIGVAVAATAGAACTIQVDAWQLEKGSSASAWAQPGVWYPMYLGYTNQWKPAFSGNQYSTVTPNSVDALSLLSQYILDNPLTEALTAAGARFVYRLDEGSGATQFADATGNNGVVGIINSKNGAGSISPGTQITATDPVNGVFTGSSGTVTTFANPHPGQGAGFASSVISLPTAGIVGPTNPASWTRAIAFRYTGPTPTDAACIWSSMDRQHAATGTVATGSRVFLFISTDSHLHLTIGGPGGSYGSVTFTANNGSFPNVVDGNWHLAIFGWNESTGEMRTSLDGANWFFTGFTSAITPTGLVSDSVGAWYDVGLGGAAGNNWQGDLAFAAEFTTYLFNPNTDAIYAAWKNSFTGESTNARYLRILSYASNEVGWIIQPGLTRSMGPADFAGQDAFTALQAVVDTEGGSHFVDAAGWLNFRSRGDRYNATVPIYTFGENVAGGEFPYESIDPDYDTTHLANVATVSQVSPASKFTAQDSTSVAAYGPRTMTRTVNSTSPQECQDAASYLVSRYKQPAYRVAALKLHPSAYPALWPVLLGLELGTRVRVMKRPFGAPAITIDCFVESIQYDLSDQNDAWCTLQCSPADLTPYGILAAWHTTLKTTVASGVTSITINNSADNTNPLAAQLAAGTQIVLGQNTANQETVTVLSVGATSTGWTSAVLTLTAATTKAHTAGDLINEALPAGTTDPTTWDAVAKFDSVAFAY